MKFTFMASLLLCPPNIVSAPFRNWTRNPLLHRPHFHAFSCSSRDFLSWSLSVTWFGFKPGFLPESDDAEHVIRELFGRAEGLLYTIAKSEQLSTVQDHEDDSDVLIECREVYKPFGEKKILNGVSFKTRHGEAIRIIGPSGTGKSTVLKIIAGLPAPDKGEVYIRGRKRAGLISDDEISRLRIGLVFQSAALFDSLTIHENVGFLLYEHSSMSEDQISELVKESLAVVGLKVQYLVQPLTLGILVCALKR